MLSAFILRLAAEAALACARANRQQNPQMLCLMFMLRDAADAIEDQHG